MEEDVAGTIARLQDEIQKIRDLALLAQDPEQRSSMLKTARLIEHSIREFDRHA